MQAHREISVGEGANPAACSLLRPTANFQALNKLGVEAEVDGKRVRVLGCAVPRLGNPSLPYLCWCGESAEFRLCRHKRVALAPHETRITADPL